MRRIWPHRLLGHRWRYHGIRTCPACQRVHKVWTCHCSAVREDA